KSDFRILNIKHTPFGERKILDRNAELLRHRQHQLFARSLSSLNRCVTSHQSHATRIAAEIDRRQIGIGSNYANIKRIDSENLCDDVSEYRIGTLPDVGRAAHHTDAALPV